MAKSKTIFVCSQCGYETVKWLGRCPSCGGWNCFDETVSASPSASPAKNAAMHSVKTQPLLSVREIDETDEIRFHTGISELDRVLGGGIVKGSLVLLGGDPGIGKSTLLLQIW